MGVGYPFIYILTNRKTQKCYTAIFQYINSSIFSLNPIVIISDYERGLRNSIRTVFPDAKMLGCWFHFCQAIRKKMVNKFKALRGYIKTSTDAQKLYRQTMFLALLPAESIPPTLKYIQDNASNLPQGNKFTAFFTYFRKQWINNKLYKLNINKKQQTKFKKLINFILIYLFLFGRKDQLTFRYSTSQREPHPVLKIITGSSVNKPKQREGFSNSSN